MPEIEENVVYWSTNCKGQQVSMNEKGAGEQVADCEAAVTSRWYHCASCNDSWRMNKEVLSKSSGGPTSALVWTSTNFNKLKSCSRDTAHACDV